MKEATVTYLVHSARWRSRCVTREQWLPTSRPASTRASVNLTAKAAFEVKLKRASPIVARVRLCGDSSGSRSTSAGEGAVIPGKIGVGVGSAPSDRTPVPVNSTCCNPVSSLLLMTHASPALPGAVGVKLTTSDTLAPGAIVVPSSSRVCAANSPPKGGFDFEIVTVVPPVLVIVKLFVAVVPTATDPKSLLSLVICRWPGAPALPDTPRIALPPLLSISSVLLKTPVEVGSNARVTVTDPPGGIDSSTLGKPLALNGGFGGWMAVIVTGVAPALLNVALPESSLPTVVPPSDTSDWFTVSRPVAACPVPASENGIVVPSLRVTLISPPIVPTALGANVTGTDSVWPVLSAAGSTCEGVPGLN